MAKNMRKNKKFEAIYPAVVRDIIAKSKTYLMPGNDWEAQDTAQELAIQLWLKSDKYNPKLASARTWGNRVISRKIIDIYRKRIKGW